MRWKEKIIKINKKFNKIELPEHGDTRVFRKFLFLPKCILNEWRWFEYATYEARLELINPPYFTYWVGVRWINF